MSVTSQRATTIAFSGDITASETFSAANNTTTPAQINIQTLASGANTITPPTVGSGGATAVTIIPPAGNTATITLKGVSGDTGVVLHKTDPTTVALNSPTNTFVLSASA